MSAVEPPCPEGVPAGVWAYVLRYQRLDPGEPAPQVAADLTDLLTHALDPTSLPVPA